MVARHATAIYVVLGKGHLSFRQTGLGGASEPNGGLGVVMRHAVAVGEHAAVPILRIHHALSRTFEPERGALVVARHADTLSKADRVIERADQVALLGSALEPLVQGWWWIVGQGGYRPRLQQRREIGLGRRVAGVGGALEPVRR